MDLMKKVPLPMKVPTLSDDDSGHRVRPVSYLGAEPDASSQTVVVRLLDPNNQMLSLLLTPSVQKPWYFGCPSHCLGWLRRRTSR